jgi:hypothetical protein
MSLFRFLRAGSRSSIIRSLFVTLSLSLARLRECALTSSHHGEAEIRAIHAVLTRWVSLSAPMAGIYTVGILG